MKGNKVDKKKYWLTCLVAFAIAYAVTVVIDLIVHAF